MARSFILSNPQYWTGQSGRRRRKRRPLPVWFTINDVAKQVGIHRNSARWYVAQERLIPMARTASGLDLFNEVQVTEFVAWHRGRTTRNGKRK